MYEILLPNENGDHIQYEYGLSLKQALDLAKENLGADELGKISIVNKVADISDADDSADEAIILFKGHAKAAIENIKECAGLAFFILLKSFKG